MRCIVDKRRDINRSAAMRRVASRHAVPCRAVPCRVTASRWTQSKARTCRAASRRSTPHATRGGRTTSRVRICIYLSGPERDEDAFLPQGRLENSTTAVCVHRRLCGTTRYHLTNTRRRQQPPRATTPLLRPLVCVPPRRRAHTRRAYPGTHPMPIGEAEETSSYATRAKTKTDAMKREVERGEAA